jgi:TATA-box binding protein (TBP) (component of TFIID and TFIIIB)
MFLIDTGFNFNTIRTPLEFSFENTEEKEIFPGEVYRLEV